MLRLGLRLRSRGVDWVSDDIRLGVVRTIYSAFMLFGMYLCATAACSVLQQLYLRVPLKYRALRPCDSRRLVVRSQKNVNDVRYVFLLQQPPGRAFTYWVGRGILFCTPLARAARAPLRPPGAEGPPEAHRIAEFLQLGCRFMTGN